MNAQTHSTPFSKEIFESFWPLSGVKVGKILQQRDGKRVGGIFANEGDFVFKVANPERGEENITRDTFAFNFLKARNFQHIPALLQTRERENYQNVGVKFVFVMERIEGSKKGQTPAATELGSLGGHEYYFLRTRFGKLIYELSAEQLIKDGISQLLGELKSA